MAAQWKSLLFASVVGTTCLWGATHMELQAGEVAPATRAKTAPAAKPFELQCDAGPAKAVKTKSGQAAHIRTAAQKGLNFLSTTTVKWQTQHQCFGCHVQGVTGEALSVGLHNQYEVSDQHVSTVFDGVLNINGGLRTTSGHASPNGSLRLSSRAFGGASLARYDRWVSAEFGDDLLNAAHDLLPYQAESGIVAGGYRGGKVASGDLQSTYQAVQTWKQAYERSADDRWLTAISRAENAVRAQLDAWHTNGPLTIQEWNYALLTLVESGASATDASVEGVKTKLLEAQNEDGGWALNVGSKGASEVLATGQTLYALRMLGLNDGDAPIKRGIDWLVEKQATDGSWSHGGSEKGDAMWAVLGLVKTDVMSINVDGIARYQRLPADSIAITASADANGGAAVKKVEVLVDDILVSGSCDARTEFTWKTAGLDKGRHTLDILATNTAGQTSRRRFEVYAGDIWVTNLGTRFDGGRTLLSMRDLGASANRTIDVEIWSTEEKDGADVAAKHLHTLSAEGKEGPVTFVWDGRANDKPVESGDYIARVRVKDAAGKTLQSEDLNFVHASAARQAADYADINGSLNFGNDEAAANAWVELVDERGNIVQRVQSTSSGSYRFRNLKPGRKFKVRASKKGFAPAEATVEADKEKDAKLDFTLE